MMEALLHLMLMITIHDWLSGRFGFVSLLTVGHRLGVRTFSVAL